MKAAIKIRLRLMKEALLRDTARCVFCGKGPTTHEHVFSKWTRKHLLSRRRAQTFFQIQTRYRNRLERAQFKIKAARDWQPKCVCKSCNSDWMSQIETRAKSVMEPLIKGAPSTLGDKDKEAIATWAILKVMVVHHRIVKAKQKREMFKKRRPPNWWAVWIGHYNRGSWTQEWGSTPFRIDEDFKFESGKLPRGWPANAHASTQIIKNLLIHVVHGPNHRLVNWWRFSPPRAQISGNLIKIWPPTGVGIRHWPQAALSDADARTATYALISWLMRDAERRGLAPRSDQVPTLSV